MICGTRIYFVARMLDKYLPCTYYFNADKNYYYNTPQKFQIKVH